MKHRVVQVEPHLEPWRTLTGEYPAAADLASRLRFLLNYAVLAPSPYNSQPWRFEVSGNQVRLCAERSRSRPVADADGRELVISCGAALLHLRVAARYFGLRYALYIAPDTDQPDFLAMMEIVGEQPQTQHEANLFAAMPRRHTHRGAFDERPLSAGLLRRLREAAKSEGVQAQTIVRGPVQESVLAVAFEAERSHWRDPRYCREWANWLRRDESAALMGDGLPAGALNLPPSLLPWLPLMMRSLPAGLVPGQTSSVSALVAPAVVSLETPGNGTREWMLAGQALARVLLTAAGAGAEASYLSHAIQSPLYCGTVRELLHTTLQPQVLLRVGYHAGGAPVPRRTVGEVTTSLPHKTNHA